jgi:hypothetical protein
MTGPSLPRRLFPRPQSPDVSAADAAWQRHPLRIPAIWCDQFRPSPAGATPGSSIVDVSTCSRARPRGGATVDRRPILRFADWLVLGVSACLIGFMLLPRTLPEQPARVTTWPSASLSSPVDDATGVISPNGEGAHVESLPAVSNLPRRLPAAPIRTHVDPDARRAEGDARLYLRDAAAAAHRYDRVGRGRGETRTALWINAPASIGSTSPTQASPSTLSGTE